MPRSERPPVRIRDVKPRRGRVRAQRYSYDVPTWREEGAAEPGSGTSVGRSEWFHDAGVGSVWENRMAEVESGRMYRLLYEALHLGNLGLYFSMLGAGPYWESGVLVVRYKNTDHSKFCGITASG